MTWKVDVFYRELKTTVDNILLINKFRRKYPDAEDIMAGEKTIFNFWMDYFVKAAKTDIDDSIRFPVNGIIITIIFIPITS